MAEYILKQKNMVDEEEENFVIALQVIHSGGLPMVLKAVDELDVFNIIAKEGSGSGSGHLSAKEIVAKFATPVKQEPEKAASMLDRMLRLLATHSVLSCTVDTADDGGSVRRYGLAPLSKLFIPDENGVSLGPFLALVEDHVVRASWSKQKDALLEGGIPFKMAHGAQGFEYAGLDPRFNSVFNKAMINYTTIIVYKIIKKYKNFGNIDLLVDVGGGVGHTLHAIRSNYPSIKGINFDLPHVISNAKPYPGVEHVAGNMFDSVPKGDAILMKGILHDWSDSHCVQLLKNCYAALPQNGKVIALEMILTEEPEKTTLAKETSQFDLYLMNIGGGERTKKELLDLAITSGFTSINVDCRVGHFWIIEFLK